MRRFALTVATVELANQSVLRIPVGGRLAFEHALASRRSRLWTNDLLRKIKGLGQSLTYEALLALEEYQSAFFLRVMRREIRILFGMDPSEIAESSRFDPHSRLH